MTNATDMGYGSEGICPHCKHFEYCIGSTKDKQTSRQRMCYGKETWYPACSTGDIGLDSRLGLSEIRTIEYGYKFEERCKI